jgi:hypothetical protein
MKANRKSQTTRETKHQLAGRKNISIAPEVFDLALTLMDRRAFSKFSHLLAALIREECDRRGVPFPVAPRGKP